jgi:hypothetical protein
MVGCGQQVCQPQRCQRTQAEALAIPMWRKVPVQQIWYAHPHLLRKQYRNVVYAFGSYGKCIGHADKFTAISKAHRKMGEC